jgi:hypothetical protein
LSHLRFRSVVGFALILGALLSAEPSNLAHATGSVTSTRSRLPQLSAEPNKLLSNGYGVEPYVAVGKNGTIHVVWMENGGIWYRDSIDGGQTFTQATVVSEISCSDCGEGNGDPSIAIMPNGDVVVAFVNYIWNPTTQRSSNNHLILATKSSSGDVFVFVNRIVESCHACFDRSWVSATSTGRVYLIWAEPFNPSRGTFWAMSKDGGSTFSPPASLDFEDGAWPTGAVVDDNGNLHVAMIGWSDSKTPNEILYGEVDNNGLLSSNSGSVVAGVSMPYSFGASSPQAFWPGPAIAVDHSNTYMIYSSDLGESLYLRHSGNDGFGWDPPILVRGGHGLVEMPWAAALNGSLLIAWRENGSGFWNTYLTLYANGTFTEPLKISDHNGFPGNVNDWHGDFLSVAFMNSNEAAIAWSDGRNVPQYSQSSCYRFGHNCGDIYFSVVHMIYPGSSNTTSTQTNSAASTSSMWTTSQVTTASSSLMMPLQTVSPSGLNATFAAAAIGVVALGAISVIVILRKRRMIKG